MNRNKHYENGNCVDCEEGLVTFNNKCHNCSTPIPHCSACSLNENEHNSLF